MIDANKIMLAMLTMSVTVLHSQSRHTNYNQNEDNFWHIVCAYNVFWGSFSLIISLAINIIDSYSHIDHANRRRIHFVSVTKMCIYAPLFDVSSQSHRNSSFFVSLCARSF